MSELKVNKISPATGTAFALGDSGDTFTVPSGATIVNSGTATGFGVARNTVSGCWIDFNGEGTVAIRDSYNVSSLTDDATGTYTVNFDADCGDANYATIANCTYPSGTNNHHISLGNAASGYGVAAVAAGSCKLYVVYDGSAPQDVTRVAALFYGDFS